MDEPKRRSLVPTSFAGSALASLRERVRDLGVRAERSEASATDLVVRAVASRADKILARLEGTSEVLERAARIELRILEKLEPIVDDLGTLVKMQLAEMMSRTSTRGDNHERGGDDIIDVTDDGHLDPRASRRSR